MKKYLMIGLVCLSIVLGVSVSIVSTQSKRNLARLESEVSRLEAASKDLTRQMNLSIEFGINPLIVKVVEDQSKHIIDGDEIAWRFMKDDKEIAYLLLSMIKVESNGQILATNRTDAIPTYGLLQMQLGTAKAYKKDVTIEDLYNVQTHMEIAAQHFKALMKRYNGNWVLATLAWNRGEGRVNKLIAMGDSPANGYAGKVFRAALKENALN